MMHSWIINFELMSGELMENCFLKIYQNQTGSLWKQRNTQKNKHQTGDSIYRPIEETYKVRLK